LDLFDFFDSLEEALEDALDVETAFDEAFEGTLDTLDTPDTWEKAEEEEETDEAVLSLSLGGSLLLLSLDGFGKGSKGRSVTDELLEDWEGFVTLTTFTLGAFRSSVSPVIL